DLGFGAVDDLIHYWVVTAPDLAGATQFDLIRSIPGSNHIDVKQVSAQVYYRLHYDSNGDTFFVNGNSRTLAQFESSLTGLTLPDLDGAGPLELETEPYSAASGGSSVFRLNT
ncbi:MAG: hypothetical protein ACT4OP_11275, partial [Actinomycetota bacterium]